MAMRQFPDGTEGEDASAGGNGAEERDASSGAAPPPQSQSPVRRDSERLLRARIMGMGNQSMRKSYYPQLQNRLEELERYKQLLDRAHEGILLLQQPQLRVTDANFAAGELLNVPMHTLRGRVLDELLPADAAQDLRLWAEGLQPGTEANLQLTFCLGAQPPAEQVPVGRASDAEADGRWLELSLSCAGQDGLVGLVAIVRDITAFYRQNEALRNSERTLHAIFDNSFQFTGMLDTQGRMLAVNRPALNSIEAKEEDVLGCFFWETPWWRDVPLEQEKLRDAFHRCVQGETVRFHSLHCTAGGNRLVVDFSLKPVFDEAGRVVLVIPEGRDITQMRRLEEQLAHSQKMDSIGQLAGGVAHDFNNLLGGIIGSADLLAYMGPLNEEQQKLVKIILGAADNAAELTNKLLAFARKEKAVSTAIDIHEVLQEVRLLLERSVDKRIQIRLRLEAQACRVVGDPSQLKSAFLNLGINARDAMPEGGRLEFATCTRVLDAVECVALSDDMAPGTYLEVRVSDTGCGIPPEYLKKIFEPFFTTKEVGKGTGLGLAAVYGMVMSHHGAVTVESEVGRGTSFTVLLPLEAAEGQAHLREEGIPQPKQGGCVLVADDEQINRTTITMMLEKMGFSVLLAQDGVEAVDVFRANRDTIRVVLLDLVMPQMNGEDAFDAIRAIDPEAKILVMSGFTANISVRRLQERGALGFVHKPFRIADLSAALAKAEQ